MKHFLWSLVLVFLAAAPAWSKPNFVSINRPPSTSGGTLLFGIEDTEDSAAIGVGGFCTVRFEQASGDDVSLYAVTSQSTAATSGTLLKAFTSSTSPSNPAYTFTASTQWVKAKAVDATAGGSKLIIECNPTFGSSGGGGGGSFDACRSGQTQGGGYSSTDGRWAWTCGNYPWREWQDATAANSASYTVECTGDGTPHTSCFRSGETRYIGYGLNIAVAAQYTRDGGKVYLPEGVYVDNGAGRNEAGSATDFPHPYDPEWEARSDFSSLGYPTALRVMQFNRGVRLIGEGTPNAITYDVSDTSVSDNRPKLSGTWILDDRGTAYGLDGSSTYSGVGWTGGGPSGGTNTGIRPPTYYRMLVGGNPYLSYCYTTSNTDPACDHTQTDDTVEAATDAPNGASLWGAGFATLANYDTAVGTLCVPDADSSLGSSQTDAIGTCSLNRMIRCWDDADSDQPRSSGGCNFGAGGNFGACESPFTALSADYTTAGQDLQLAMLWSECADNASSSADCDGDQGVEIYVQDIRAAPGASITGSSCAAGAGTEVTVGNAKPSNDFSTTLPFRNFYVGGTGAYNTIFPIRRGGMDGRGAGFEHIGRMPANWLTRDSTTAAADCLSAGTISVANDEVACDTDTLSGFAMSYNNLIGPDNFFFKASQAAGVKSAIVETFPSGGRNDFIGNRIRTHYRQTVVDWGNGTLGFNHFSDLSAYPGTPYGVFDCFSGECTFESNIVENSAGTYLYQFLRAAQRSVVRNNIYRNTFLTAYGYLVIGIKNLLVDGDQFFGTYGTSMARIQPGYSSVQKPTMIFRNIQGYMQTDPTASNATLGGGVPAAIYVVKSDGTANANPDDYKSLLIENNDIKSKSDDVCLVWFEDDFYNSGGAGGGADTNALTREAASRAFLLNNNLTSGVSGDGPKIACTGKYEFVASTFDSDNSDEWAVEAYAPKLVGNRVNNAPVPDMLPTISEANVEVASNLPDGTVVRVHDGTAGCAHSSGNLTAGAVTETCINDQSANTWAVWP